MNTFKKKFLIGALSCAMIACCGTSIALTKASALENGEAVESPLALKGASIKFQQEETGDRVSSAIRFVSAIEEETYKELEKTYGDLTVVTRVVPSYILGTAELKWDTVLSDKSKGDILDFNMTGKQFEETFETDPTIYYVFKSYIRNIPSWAYYLDLSAMTYIVDADGNLVCETSAVEKSIGMVAEAAYNDVSNEYDEKTYKYETEAGSGIYSPYIASNRACLKNYIDEEAPVIEIEKSNKQQEVVASMEFTLSAATLGLTILDNFDKNVELSYEVVYNDQTIINLTNNTFTTAESGYYGVNVTATDDAGNQSKEYILLNVQGTNVYGFDNVDAISGVFVGASLSKGENGNNALIYTPAQTATSAKTFNFSTKYFNYDSAWNGKDVYASFIVRVEGKFTAAAGWGTVYFESAANNTKIISQELISGTNLENSVYRVNIKTTLGYDNGTKDYRFSNFKVTTYGDKIDSNNPVALYFDNFVIMKDEIAPVMTVTNREISIPASTTFAMTAENLGLKFDENVTLSFAVKENGVTDVDVSSGELTTVATGYYDVIVTAQDSQGNTVTTYLLLYVEGTYVYGFNNISALSGTWVCNGSSGSLYADENGNKAWKLVPNQTTTAATSINIPALNHATNMENQEVTVSFLVKVDGTFTNAAGWGTLLFEKTSTTTTIVSQELVSGTKLVDGVYKITLKTKLSYDSGTKNYRISGFKFTTYGSAIDANDPVSLYIDNMVLSLA